MAHFFFHLHECGDLTRDEEGRDVADLNAACDLAILDARSLMTDEIAHGRLCMSCYVVIEDASHTEVARVLFKDAVKVSGI